MFVGKGGGIDVGREERSQMSFLAKQQKEGDTGGKRSLLIKGKGEGGGSSRDKSPPLLNKN